MNHGRRRYIVGLYLILLLITAAVGAGASRDLSAGAVVLVNKQAPDYAEFRDLIEPYLIQFGVPYAVRDISDPNAFKELSDFALIIIGHRGLDVPQRFLTPEKNKALIAAVRSGTGLLDFDGLFTAWHGKEPVTVCGFGEKIFGQIVSRGGQADAITVEGSHFITSLKRVPCEIRLKEPISVYSILPAEGSSVLARAGDYPLVVTASAGSGRAVLFMSYDWVRPSVKGKLYGFDDLVWRSIVWAARKPFVMRGMPKFLAFRVDDVSGFGIGSNQHLGWVETANRYGLKPWLGIFIDDLREDPESVKNLAELTQKGSATAGLHARRWTEFFFLNEPLITDIEIRYTAGRPWPDDVMDANFRDAREFFEQNGIVKSSVVMPHFYELVPNDFKGLKEWGAEFVGTMLEPGKGYGTLIPGSGPYLSGEPPRSSRAKDPLFISDWLEVPGHPEFDGEFFDFVVEIRDDAGYEWAPGGVSVEEAIRRGVDQSRREFDSLVPAVLFTHESDHIQKITPEDWENILAGVTRGLKSYRPIPVTLDFVMQYMRALNTSRIYAAGSGGVEFTGKSDIPTMFYVYGEDIEAPCEMKAPAFQGHIKINYEGMDK